MKASFVDLRKKSREIIRALDRNEHVTVLYRGRPKAIMRPIAHQGEHPGVKTVDHAAFGLWKDRQDLRDVPSHVRKLRQGRFRDL
ncbi:MAG: type II toxin-antitoxin system prevent-host-death family antitoxin [Phycisphaerae bacterium]|nr:type II toxin-antitoxin system prevent-host-death family antitoxin [Phycisphaerae bacterium]